MHDAGIGDGDPLVVDRSSSTVHGDIVIMAVAGEFIVKEPRTHPSLQLVPHNRDYASISSHNTEELEILGMVVFSIKAYK